MESTTTNMHKIDKTNFFISENLLRKIMERLDLMDQGEQDLKNIVD